MVLWPECLVMMAKLFCRGDEKKVGLDWLFNHATQISEVKSKDRLQMGSFW